MIVYKIIRYFSVNITSCHDLGDTFALLKILLPILEMILHIFGNILAFPGPTFAYFEILFGMIKYKFLRLFLHVLQTCGLGLAGVSELHYIVYCR